MGSGPRNIATVRKAEVGVDDLRVARQARDDAQ
jgi:hypothetical protein